MPQVRAIASQHLERLKFMAAERGQVHDADGAHFALLASDIHRFQERPYGALTAPGTPSAPPGAPIGSPALDWIGGNGGPSAFLLGGSGFGGHGPPTAGLAGYGSPKPGLGAYGSVPSVLAAYGWLAELAPWCSFESW